MLKPRTGIRWNQWLQTPGQVTFREGDRVFEFSEDDSPTGWRPYDAAVQIQLRRLFLNMTNGASRENARFIGPRVAYLDGLVAIRSSRATPRVG